MRRLLLWVAVTVLALLVYKYIWACLVIAVLLIIFTKPGRKLAIMLWSLCR